MRTVVLLSFLLLSGCDNAQNETYSPPPIETYPTSQDDYSSSENANNGVPPVPTRPTHNYDARDGLFYSYIAALSEDDKKAGKAAGEVFTFAYLGKRGEKHVLARVLANGKVLGEIYCGEPCRIISYPDGSQIAFNEGSIIGAAFADAIAGRLQTASYQQPAQPIVSPPPASPVGSQSSDQKWSASEADLILRWMDANDKCRGSSNQAIIADACANRDEVYGPALAQAGICYGKRNEPASSSTMHRCGQDSLGLDW